MKAHACTFLRVTKERKQSERNEDGWTTKESRQNSRTENQTNQEVRELMLVKTKILQLKNNLCIAPLPPNGQTIVKKSLETDTLRKRYKTFSKKALENPKNDDKLKTTRKRLASPNSIWKYVLNLHF